MFSTTFLEKIFVSSLYQNKRVIKEIAENTISCQVCVWSLHTANTIGIVKNILFYIDIGQFFKHSTANYLALFWGLKSMYIL